MDKRIYISVIIILSFASVGVVFYNFFEIYPKKNNIPPSREVSANVYYGMEQWLKETGHNVRIMEIFNPDMLETIPEKVILALNGSSCWNDTEMLLPWIEQGGFLVISIDRHSEENNPLYEFLLGLGITVEFIQSTINQISQEPYDDEPENIPDFQARISFHAEDEDNVFVIKDNEGIIRLAEISIGNGALTVIGLPVFMYNQNLRKEENALLAWKLTGERTKNDSRDILFVRYQNIRARNSMFGAIMERGNPVPVIISSLILVILGFWMVIPVFGLVSSEKHAASRPIKDRFTAEIRFLKKYEALNHYLNVYRREQKQEHAKKEKTYNYRELINQYRSIFDGTEKF